VDMSSMILIVDDDSEFRHEMRDCLSKYRVTEASNGLEALEILSKPNSIELIVLDVMMPYMSGIEVLRQIKKIKPNLGIVILTGQSSKDIAIEALKAHADDYVEKPFDIDKFLSMVQKILDSKKRSATGYINKMDRIKMFIENNADKKISLHHVADEVALSSKYLSRLFKEKVGTGFNEYRLKIKIDKAGDLLKMSDSTIESIAVQVGYKNAESFIRMFEKIKGLTPTQYREKNRAKSRK
jgi:YesN/AraC family two-component response regulator